MKDDPWGATHASGISLAGRVVLNVWRILKSELKLRQTSFEYVVAEQLKVRVPHYSYATRHRWYVGVVDNVDDGVAGVRPAEGSASASSASGSSASGSSASGDPESMPQSYSGGGRANGSRSRLLRHLLRRVALTLRLVDQLNVMNRTAEMSRLLRVDFFSVISRGSQYRVEAVLLQVTKPLNFLLLAASREQVAQQPGMECLPLVMVSGLDLFWSNSFTAKIRMHVHSTVVPLHVHLF
jgi:DNA polymerase zeta